MTLNRAADADPTDSGEGFTAVEIERFVIFAGDGGDVINIDDLNGLGITDLDILLDGRSDGGSSADADPLDLDPSDDGDADRVIFDIESTNDDTFTITTPTTDTVEIDHSGFVATLLGASWTLDGDGSNDDTLEIKAGLGADVIDATGVDKRQIQLQLRGEAGDDIVRGSDFEDVIDGGLDDDILTGGPGLDQFFDEGGTDTLEEVTALADDRAIDVLLTDNAYITGDSLE